MKSLFLPVLALVVSSTPARPRRPAAGTGATPAIRSDAGSGPQHRGSQAESLTSLQRGFERPPADARMMVRWWWFGPAITTAELDRELREMKAAGIGGFEVQPVYPLALDDPTSGFKNLPYLSNSFLAALRFTAIRARELGMRMDLTLGSGWPYGGPSVPVTQAAGMLRIVRFPLASTEHAGMGVRRMMPPALSTGERMIAAYVVRRDEHGGLDWRGARAAPFDDGGIEIPPGAATESAPRGNDAAVTSAATGEPELLVFIGSRTGMQVKRAAAGAEGFVLDHYDRQAVANYLDTTGDRLMSAFAGNGPAPTGTADNRFAAPHDSNTVFIGAPVAVFCDSLEVEGSDWTGDLFAAFQKRHGYDLRRYLPALADDGRGSAAIRHDWGETLTQIFNDRFVRQVQGWARAHHTQFRAQLYGTPPAILSSYRLMDLPEGERAGARWNEFSPLRLASSAGHVYGRRVISSETFTWLHSPAFRATPLDMKAEADLHFLTGINQIVAHGWPYSPEGIAEPGWRFYAAGAFNAHNPWWPAMREVAGYLQRVSYLLRQGQPVDDIAVYLPNHDAWAHFIPGHVSVNEWFARRLDAQVLQAILAGGYNFDFVDDEALTAAAGRYRAIVLPDVERIPLQTLDRMQRFARDGGVLMAVGRMPSLSPWHLQQAEASRKVKELSDELFGGSREGGGGRGTSVFVAQAGDLGARLNALVAPDATLDRPELGFVHRRLAYADIYFVVNTSNRPLDVDAHFRTAHSNAEEWDPFNRNFYALESERASRDAPPQRGPARERADSAAGNWAGSAGSRAVRLHFEPYESRIVVFTDRETRTDGSAAARSAQLLARPDGAGNRASSNDPPPQAAAGHPPLDLSLDWTVTFPRGISGPVPGADAGRSGTAVGSANPLSGSTIHMHVLRSWTKEPGLRFYSGSAIYTKEFTLPADWPLAGGRTMLDFGQGAALAPEGAEAQPTMRAWLESPVRDAAVVYVNAAPAGTVWSPPFRIEIGDLLRPGRNRLRILVGNTAMNEMAGEPQPDYRLLNRRYGVRFRPQDMDRVRPLPSGLLGAIRIMALPARMVVTSPGR
jgi:hypothetical protein